MRRQYWLTVLGVALFASLSLAQMRIDGVPRLLGRNPTIFVGTGAANPTVGGVLTATVTSAGTIADTNETDLWTYSLPANTLSANTKGVRITVYASTAANGNTKTLKTYFGATAISTLSSAYNGVTWRMVGEVLRTGASAELGHMLATGTPGGLTSTERSTPAADTTATITIKFTGTNGTAAANDIVFRGAIVEALNAP